MENGHGYASGPIHYQFRYIDGSQKDSLLRRANIKKKLNTLRDIFLFILFKSNLAPISITIGVP